VERQSLEAVSERMARDHKMIPLYRLGRTIAVAVADPFNIYAVDEIQQRSGCDVLVVVTTESAVERAIDHYYRVTDSVREVIKTLSASREGAPVAEMEAAEEERMAQEPPVVRLVNLVMTQAIRDRASDVHLEPRRDALHVRYRIDGILHETLKIPKRLETAVITRVKILAGMDIAERRRPQDGHIELEREDTRLDMRVATFPTTHGEQVVMRLLYRGGVIYGMTELGFEPEMLAQFERALNQPHGLLLSTGPTGCGKTTTLYAALDTVNTPEKKILTIEDPVEYEMDLINQSQVNPKAGLSFAAGLRAMFRLDPDIILVGEMRDLESCQIAIQAALTGHLVFSSLHTNDAPSAPTRLVDMGVEPYLVASTLLCVVSQRLVRKLCDRCKEAYEPSDWEREALRLDPEKEYVFFRPKGCKHCSHTGFHGRTGIFEVLIPNETVRRLVVAKAPTSAIREAAVDSGMMTMQDTGIRKVLAGVTTPAEILRVTGDEALMSY